MQEIRFDLIKRGINEALIDKFVDTLLDDLNTSNAQTVIFEITKLLNQCAYQYYVENNPTISDYEYDNLYRELVDLEKAYPE